MEARAAPAPEPERLCFRFTGSGGEFFRIWIVNLALTILTLGIYSAWAKVRTNRYFWGSTRLGGAAFEYLASPVAILKGRLLVLGFFGVYAVASALWPLVEAPFALAVVAILPWAIVRSLAFRAQNTAWRGLRFGFHGRYGDALAIYVGLPFLTALSLGLVYPYLVYRQKRFVVEGSRYGTAPFRFGARPGDFYRLLLRVVGIALGGIALVGAVIALAPRDGFAGLAAGLAFLPLYVYLFAYASAGTWNLGYHGSSLEGHVFESDLRPRELFGIYLTNVMGILATLGLFLPWAQVRVARYRLSRLGLWLQGDLDSFVAAQREEVGSTGAELGEMLDFDIGL